MISEIRLIHNIRTMSIWDWNSVGNASQWTHSGLLVGFLDGVSNDFRVPAVHRWGPFKGHIEAPGVHDLRSGRGTGKLCRGQHEYIKLKGPFVVFGAPYGEWGRQAAPSRSGSMRESVTVNPPSLSGEQPVMGSRSITGPFGI